MSEIVRFSNSPEAIEERALAASSPINIRVSTWREQVKGSDLRVWNGCVRYTIAKTGDFCVHTSSEHKLIIQETRGGCKNILANIAHSTLDYLSDARVYSETFEFDDR